MQRESNIVQRFRTVRDLKRILEAQPADVLLVSGTTAKPSAKPSFLETTAYKLELLEPHRAKKRYF